MTLAVVYIVIRAVYLALVWHISAGNARLRASLRFRVIPVSVGLPALLFGAVFGGATQTLLWAAAFLIDCVGGLFIAVSAGRAPLPSPSHFAERHGLIVIIALGESLISVGVGAGSAVTRWPVLIAALLALTTALALWWLYFETPPHLPDKPWRGSPVRTGLGPAASPTAWLTSCSSPGSSSWPSASRWSSPT
ncbi:low temperature requirement protein A [Micromonospora sp. NPDC005163]